MPVTIERIETAGPDRRARRLVFSDTSESRLTSASVVRLLGLEEGLEVVQAELEASLKDTESAQARERALRLLGYRERSVQELRKRLIDDGYPTAITDGVIERMTESGLVDDERFARAWARTRAAAGFGSTRVRRELSLKGVDPDLSAEALAEAYAGQDPLASARKLIGNTQLVTRNDRDRAIRKLLRRGYDISTAIRAVDDSAAHE